MSEATEVKDDRRYTKDHEWALQKGSELVIGISAFAVDQLGDITLVNWNVAVGERVEAGQVFGTIESVKTLSDLFAPVGGKILRLNAELEAAPERVNEDCWDAGWMVAIQPDDPAVLSQLLSPAAYREHIASLEH
ncbi:MAG TPA: glycine cleavage system H protein [Polyangiaceae bacterium]|nr:glycine cleavage system H protein [Polyangiaceae bacterium]